MRAIGTMFAGAMGLLWMGLGLFAVGVNLYVMNEWMGGFGIILGLFLFPIMVIAAPWYALFALDWYLPLLLTYGPFFLLSVISAMFSEER